VGEEQCATIKVRQHQLEALVTEWDMRCLFME
jgi:hypothetical protein